MSLIDCHLVLFGSVGRILDALLQSHQKSDENATPFSFFNKLN